MRVSSSPAGSIWLLATAVLSILICVQTGLPSVLWAAEPTAEGGTPGDENPTGKPGAPSPSYSDAENETLLRQAIRLRRSHPEIFAGAQGVLVWDIIPGSQAQKRGIARGDIIVAYAGQPMSSKQQLLDAVRANAASAQVEIRTLHSRALLSAMLQGGPIGIMLADMDDDMAAQLFTRDFVAVLQAADDARMGELVRTDPETAKLALDYLMRKAAEPGEAAMGLLRVAEAVGKKLLELEPPDHPELDRLHEDGTQVFNAADYRGALAKWNEGLAKARDIGDDRYVGRFLANRGAAYTSLAQYPQAMASYQEALAIAHRQKNRYGARILLANMGTNLETQGLYQEALKYYEQALALNRDIPDEALNGTLIANMGVLNLELGEYDRALDTLRQAAAIFRKLGDRAGEAAVLTNTGNVHTAIGQFGHALKIQQDALAVHRELKDVQQEAGDLTNIGNALFSLNRLDEALDAYGKALDLRRRIGDRLGEAVDLGNMGYVHARLGSTEKALELNEQSLAIRREIGDLRGEGIALTNKGLILTRQKRYAEASEPLRRALELLEQTAARGSLWQAHHALAVSEAGLGRPEQAIGWYDQALATIEDLRAGLSEKGHRLSFLPDKLFVYDDFIKLLFELHASRPDKGYDQKALEIFERKQGRVMIEQVGVSGARRFGGLPEESARQEADLAQEWSGVQARLTAEYAKPRELQNFAAMRPLQARLEALTARRNGLERDIETRFPAYYTLKHPRPVALSQLQHDVLRPGEAMLIFNVMGSLTTAWVVSRDGFSLYGIKAGEQELADRVDKFRGVLAEFVQEILTGRHNGPEGPAFRQRSLMQLDEAGHGIHDLLVPEEVKAALAGTSVIYVVPTGVLYRLPFETLKARPVRGAGNDRPARYVVEDHAIAYLSSASLLKVIRDAETRKNARAEHPLLAFADPVYNKQTVSVDARPGAATSVRGAVAGDAASSLSAISDLRAANYVSILGGGFMGPIDTGDDVRAIKTIPGAPGGGFTELSDTGDEVRAIKTILGAPDSTEPLHLREAASRSKVLRLDGAGRLVDYRFIVFACHAILPGEVSYVDQPALVLSHPDPETREDGFLTMADVFGLRMNAELVALSACNTGQGTEQKGEGAMALTRAFMYAGTPAVSVTLWSVESLSAKEFNTDFFQHLSAGKHRAEALREAKLKMIRGDKGDIYRHPFFWAPTVVFGDGQ